MTASGMPNLFNAFDAGDKSTNRSRTSIRGCIGSREDSKGCTCTFSSALLSGSLTSIVCSARMRGESRRDEARAKLAEQFKEAEDAAEGKKKS